MATATSVTTQQAVAIYSNVTATDVDSYNLTYTVVTQPQHGTLSMGTNGYYSYIPNANYFGSDSFSFKANDGSADSNVATVNLTITSVNDAPVADYGGSSSTPQNTVLNGNVSAHDVDSPSLTYIIVSQPSHGTLVINSSTGAFTYTPAANYSGGDGFVFKVNDGITAVSYTHLTLPTNSRV